MTEEQKKVKRTRKRKIGTGAKYSVAMPLTFNVRMTASQKAQAMEVASITTAGTASDLWRSVVTEVSQGIVDYSQGLISDADFKARYGLLVYNIVKPEH